MKNKVWEIISGKRSIRSKMLWAVILSWTLSFSITAMLTNVINTLLPQMGILNNFIDFGIVLFVFFFFYFIFTRSIVKHFKILTEGLQSIANGNLSDQLPISREDELGLVAQNINHMAEQLYNQLERERQLEKSKMELVTYVSHDLRTPLTSIIGYLNLLKTRTFKDEKEQERYLDNAVNKTEQLKKLIDDLFEYTRLTNGDVRLHKQYIDFNNLLKQMIAEFEPVTREQQVVIISHLHSTPVFINLDSELIVRAIDNLLMNALKFTVKPGEIIVTLVVQDNRALLSIENKGKPITKQIEQQLFDRFYKGEPSRNDNSKQPGSGLGLPIARNIVELHQGRIWVEHDDGYYKFYIELDIYG